MHILIFLLIILFILAVLSILPFKKIVKVEYCGGIVLYCVFSLAYIYNINKLALNNEIIKYIQIIPITILILITLKFILYYIKKYLQYFNLGFYKECDIFTKLDSISLEILFIISTIIILILV